MPATTISTSPAATNATASRAVGLDALRILMAVLVVCLHGHVLADIDRRVSYLMEQGLCRLAVPSFFIISGFYLERLQPGQFGRWLRRALWLYLLWMGLYAGFWWVDPVASPLAFLDRLAFGYYHLWFLVALAAAGSLLFALRTLPSRTLTSLAAVLALVGLAVQYAGNYHLFGGALGHRLNQTDTYRNFLLFGFPFLTIGFLLARHETDIVLSRMDARMLLAAGLAALIVESSVNLRLAGPKEPFDILASLYLAAPALVLSARTVRVGGPGKQFALFATGLYLVHLAVLKSLAQHTDLSATPKVLLTVAISAALAAVLMGVNRRLPVL